MFYGWINVAVLWVGYAVIVMPAYYGFGSMVGPLSEGLGIDLAQASMGFTIFVFSTALSTLSVGAFVNTFGAKLTIFFGAVLYVVVGLSMGFLVDNLIWYYIVFAIMGFGCALAAPVAVHTSISYWFVRKRATAIAIAMTGGGFGAMIFSPVIAKIVAESSRWQTPWLYVALISGIGGIIVLVFARNKPSDMNQLPDGDKPGSMVNTTGVEKKSRVYKTADSWKTGSALKTPVFTLVLIGGITVIYSMSSVVSLAVTYFTGIGIEKVAAAGAIGLYGLVSIGGRLGSGILCDLYEPRYVSAAGFLLQLIAMVVLITTSNTAMCYLFAVLYGIAFGLTYICIPNLLVNYFGIENFAPINSVMWTVALALGAAAPFTTGMIVKATGSFTYAWIIVLLLAGVSCFCSMIALPPKKAEALAEKSGRLAADPS